MAARPQDPLRKLTQTVFAWLAGDGVVTRCFSKRSFLWIEIRGACADRFLAARAGVTKELHTLRLAASSRSSPEATLVLLPGLDGTEIFLQPLLAALPPEVRPLVVSYPVTGPNRYAELLAVVREAVAGLGEFHVLGWSFSGPLALMLASAEPRRVRPRCDRAAALPRRDSRGSSVGRGGDDRSEHFAMYANPRPAAQAISRFIAPSG